jgi:protoporphyrin/coproporphyrin ferrochelatase
MKKFDSILLIGFGGPESPEEVRPFIESVLAGRPVPPERIEEVVRNYEAIGGRSPYNRHISNLALALQKELDDKNLPVFTGMRVWRPLLKDTLIEMVSRNRTNALGIVLAPHQSEPSWDRYLRAIAVAQEEVRNSSGYSPQIEYLEPWYDHELFIEAVASHITKALEPLPEKSRRSAHILFTAHSIPVKQALPYTEQLEKTAQLVSRRVQMENWTICYQSRSGSPLEPWLGPDVRDVLREKAESGLSDIVVSPIGFICDHTEVLYDLDIDAKQVADSCGINMIRAGTAGLHPQFIRMFSELIRARL